LEVIIFKKNAGRGEFRWQYPPFGGRFDASNSKVYQYFYFVPAKNAAGCYYFMKMQKMSFSARLFLLSFLFPLFAEAQDNTSLNIVMQKQRYNPGDTISFDAFFTLNAKKPAKASLYLKAVDNNGKLWNMRWPVLDGVCNVDIVIPDSFPPAAMTFYFAVTHNFFSVSGQVKEHGNVKALKAILITNNRDMMMEEIPLRNNSFQYRDRLFEDEATLLLNRTRGNSDDLDIELVSTLDSFFVPIASETRHLVIGTPSDTARATDLPQSFLEIDSAMAAREKMLAPVTVTARRVSKAEQFSEKFSSGMFRTMDERLLNIMDDVSALTATNIITYLQGRVAGLRFERNAAGEYEGSWRGSGVTFYVDEMRLDAQAVSAIPVADIAIVKAFPPPFFGNFGGDGGAVAIYTKREGFYGNSKRHSFRIKGYTPLFTHLKVNPAK
jgi:hypothetical protein